MGRSELSIRLAAELEGDPTLRSVLGQLGLEAAAVNSAPPGRQAVLLTAPGGAVPEAWREVAVEVDTSAGPATVAAVVRLAVENAVLRGELASMRHDSSRDRTQFRELNRIGIALSSERDVDRLQDFILRTCRQLTRADGASLWLVEPGDEGSRIVRFSATQNHSLDVPYSAFTVPLDEHSMVGYTIVHGRSQVVDDIYDADELTPFSVAGSRSFDDRHGYRTRSMLCVPMRNHAGEVIGAVQLINAKRSHETRLHPGNVHVETQKFGRDDLEMIESIASQAAVALDNRQLVDSIQALFEGFVKASVTAIESRDPTTYGHSGRVAALTTRLAESVSEIGAGAFRDVGFTPEQMRELRYAALLHDFGKVGVREHVLVKEKKLYGAQLDFIRARFEFVQRSLQLRHAEEKLQLARSGAGSQDDFDAIDRRLATEQEELTQWIEAVAAANEPTVLDEDKASTLAFLAQRTYLDVAGTERPLLAPDEFHFLSIRRGTLDDAERLEIESHVTHSYRFLTRIPWTPAMRDVPTIAYGHHEKLDGSGYPRGLTAADIPIQTRMMTISDIYDALTATDRPYKRAVPLDRALGILKMEADEGKLDAELLDVFITRRVHEAAADYRPDEELLLR